MAPFAVEPPRRQKIETCSSTFLYVLSAIPGFVLQQRHVNYRAMTGLFKCKGKILKTYKSSAIKKSGMPSGMPLSHKVQSKNLVIRYPH